MLKLIAVKFNTLVLPVDPEGTFADLGPGWLIKTFSCIRFKLFADAFV